MVCPHKSPCDSKYRGASKEMYIILEEIVREGYTVLNLGKTPSDQAPSALSRSHFSRALPGSSRVTKRGWSLLPYIPSSLHSDSRIIQQHDTHSDISWEESITYLESNLPLPWLPDMIELSQVSSTHLCKNAELLKLTSTSLQVCG